MRQKNGPFSNTDPRYGRRSDEYVCTYVYVKKTKVHLCYKRRTRNAKLWCMYNRRGKSSRKAELARIEVLSEPIAVIYIYIAYTCKKYIYTVCIYIYIYFFFKINVFFDIVETSCNARCSARLCRRRFGGARNCLCNSQDRSKSRRSQRLEPKCDFSRKRDGYLFRRSEVGERTGNTLPIVVSVNHTVFCHMWYARAIEARIDVNPGATVIAKRHLLFIVY